MLDGRVLINRSLGEEPRRLVPQGVDVTGTVIDPRLRPNGGTIRLPCPAVTYTGREELFGREERPGYDYRTAPRKLWTKKVLVPYIENFQVVAGRPVLNMALFRADNVARVALRVKSGNATPADLQTSVNRYYDQIEDMLTGKKGLFTRDLFGFRCRNSVRCVMVPEPDLKWHQIGVPRTAAGRAKIGPSDWVLAIRSPVLWTGSVLAMQAVLVDGSAGQANPFIMKGLGLDFDGDTMSIIKVPTEPNPELAAEMRRAMHDPTPDAFEWDDEFLVLNRDKRPNWNQMSLDLNARLTVTGLSLSPEECLEPEESDFLQTVADGVKEIPEDFVQYAEGKPIADWAKDAESAALEVARLKLEVGLLGAATDKAAQVVMAFGTREQLRTVLVAKEQLTDLMMKNAKGRTGTGYDTNLVTSLLDRRGPFEEASPETALVYLRSIGLDDGEFRPIIELIYDLGGISTAIRNHMPLLQACRVRDRAALVSVLKGNWGHSSIVALVHEYGGDHEVGGVIPYSRIRAAGHARRRQGRPQGDDIQDQRRGRAS